MKWSYKRLFQIFVLSMAIFLLYSGLYIVYNIISGNTPPIKVPFFVIQLPYVYVIPTSFLILGVYFLIAALGLTVYLDNLVGKIIRAIIFAISINFLYIGIYMPFLVKHLTLDQLFTYGAAGAGLAIPGGLALHIIGQHIIGGGILGPLLSIKHKIFVKVKQLVGRG